MEWKKTDPVSQFRTSGKATGHVTVFPDGNLGVVALEDMPIRFRIYVPSKPDTDLGSVRNLSAPTTWSILRMKPVTSGVLESEEVWIDRTTGTLTYLYGSRDDVTKVAAFTKELHGTCSKTPAPKLKF